MTTRRYIIRNSFARDVSGSNAHNQGICHLGKSGPGSDPACGARGAHSSFGFEKFGELGAESQCKRCQAKFEQRKALKERIAAQRAQDVVTPEDVAYGEGFRAQRGAINPYGDKERKEAWERGYYKARNNYKMRSNYWAGELKHKRFEPPRARDAQHAFEVLLYNRQTGNGWTGEVTAASRVEAEQRAKTVFARWLSKGYTISEVLQLDAARDTDIEALARKLYVASQKTASKPMRSNYFAGELKHKRFEPPKARDATEQPTELKKAAAYKLGKSHAYTHGHTHNMPAYGGQFPGPADRELTYAYQRGFSDGRKEKQSRRAQDADVEALAQKLYAASQKTTSKPEWSHASPSVREQWTNAARIQLRSQVGARDDSHAELLEALYTPRTERTDRQKQLVEQYMNQPVVRRGSASTAALQRSQKRLGHMHDRRTIVIDSRDYKSERGFVGKVIGPNGSVIEQSEPFISERSARGWLNQQVERFMRLGKRVQTQVAPVFFDPAFARA